MGRRELPNERAVLFKAQPNRDGMRQIVYSLGGAAVAAGLIVAVLGGSPQVQASSPGNTSDRADLRSRGASCSQNPWPYYEPGCLRDARKPFGQADRVRLVSADGLRHR